MRILQFFLAAALIALPVRAQDAVPPAHISFVDGSAVVYHAFDNLSPDARGTRPDSEPAVLNMPIVQGDRVRTFAGGRVDVMFPDGASIAIDPDSEVEFVSATRVRVLSGTIEHHDRIGKAIAHCLCCLLRLAYLTTWAVVPRHVLGTHRKNAA